MVLASPKKIFFPNQKPKRVTHDTQEKYLLISSKVAITIKEIKGEKYNKVTQNYFWDKTDSCYVIVTKQE